MKHSIYIPLLLVLFTAFACNKIEQDSDIKTKPWMVEAEQSINKAELLIDQQPAQAMDILDAITVVDSLDASLLLRWCMAYGQVSADLRRNELLPQARFELTLEQNDKSCSARERAWLNFFLGNIRIEQGKVDQALELYSKAEIIALAIEEYKLAGKIETAMAWAHWSEGNYKLAQARYESAVAYYQQSGFVLGQVNALGNIAYLLIEQKQAPKALDYAMEADQMAESSGSKRIMGISSAVLAQVYRQLGDYNLAEQYGLRSIELDTINTAPNYTVLAKTYMLQQEYDRASWCLDMAETAPSLNRYTPRTIELYRAELAEALGQVQEAKQHMLKYRILRDSLALATTSHQLSGTEARIKHLQGKNSNLSESVKLRNLVMLGLVGFILLAGSGVWYFFRRQRSREVKEMLTHNDEYLVRLEQQETLFEEIEGRAYMRMRLKGRLPADMLEEWKGLVDEEMEKIMWEKLKQKEKDLRG